MRYQHSLEIHERFESVLHLIGSGRYSTPALAKIVGVSIPTISRIVAALRARGHDIQSERTRKGWQYVLKEIALPDGKRGRPTVATKSQTEHQR